ncbi:MAG TPA: hypothetical protein PLK90_07415 [Clostridiales bacterium]|nr:hypothetical protein [Clostridiales bacterium]HQP70214.1 hypothetical protein [Clostridiales bacterium]
MQDSIFIKSSSVNGRILAYPSKSHIQRALLLGLLNRNGLLIKNYAHCSDSDAMMNCIRTLGSGVEILESGIKITGPEKFTVSEPDCKDSGLCLRMLIPVLCLSGDEYFIRCSKTLISRYNEYIPRIMKQLGVCCIIKSNGIYVKGPIHSGEVKIEDPSGSQLVSGLLYALSKVQGSSKIIIKNPVSFPYIEMTADILNRFGADIQSERNGTIHINGGKEFNTGEITAEGDWSSASFFLVVAAICGEIEVCGLDTDSFQPDKAIIDYLIKAGAMVKTCPGSIVVRKAPLQSFEADIKDHPDLFLPLVVLALNCAGKSRIYNFERLKYKESDRPSAVINELSKAGAQIRLEKDHISIEKSELRYAELNPHNDHRLAMAFAAAALNSESGITISGISCVDKSFPDFFNILKRITYGSEK